MNKNLLKVLALSTLVLSIGACTSKKSGGDDPVDPVDPGETPVELTINEVFDLSAGKYVNEGKLITVKNLQVYTQYEGKLLCGFGNGGASYSKDNLKGFEVEPSELPQWTTESGAHNADVTVTGRFEDYHGRPIIREASVVVNGEGEESQYSTGVPYWSGEMDRSTWNENMGKSHNATSIEGVFQLASVPTPVSDTESSEFYVVFTAENTDATDPNNEFLIHSYIPSGLSTKAQTFWNGLFSGANVGDFYYLSPYTLYDSEFGGMGLLMEDGVSANPSYTYRIPEEEWPVILKQFSQIQAKFEEKFLEPLPNIGCEEEGVFSYTLADIFGANVDDLFDDSSFILLENHAKVGTAAMSFNCGMAKTDDVFDAIGAKALTAGFSKESSISSDEYAGYVKRDSETEKVIAEIFAQYSESGQAIDVYYFAYRATDAKFDTFAEAIDKLEERASAKLELTFESAIPSFGTTYDPSLEAVTTSWAYEDSFVESIGVYGYQLLPEFNDGTFADDDAYEAFADAYETELETAGFEPNYVVASQVMFGYYNETTGEFVSVDLITNADAHYTGVSIFVMVVGSDQVIGNTIFDTSATSKWTVGMMQSYVLQILNAIWGEEEFKAYGSSIVYSAHYNSDEDIEDYVLAYGIPSGASYLGSEDSTDEEGVNYTDYYFTLNSTTEGNLISIDVSLEHHSSGQPYSAVVFYLSEVEPE